MPPTDGAAQWGHGESTMGTAQWDGAMERHNWDMGMAQWGWYNGDGTMGTAQWGHGDGTMGTAQWGRHDGDIGMAQWGWHDGLGTMGTWGQCNGDGTMGILGWHNGDMGMAQWGQHWHQLGLGWSSWGTLQRHARGTPGTHRGFVLASRGVKALGDAAALSEMCSGGGSCFLYISRFTEVQEERKRKERGRRKGRD